MAQEPQKHDETVVFEAMVSASTGRPFVQMTCELDGTPVFAAKMAPSVAVATGLRAIQSAIEAERDAGMVAFVMEEVAPEMDVAEDARAGLAGMFLSGMRAYREQFDARAGSTRAKLSDDDPTETA